MKAVVGGRRSVYHSPFPPSGVALKRSKEACSEMYEDEQLESEKHDRECKC